MDWGRDERVVKVVLKEILEFVGDDELAVDHGWQEEHVGKVRVELFPYLLSLLKNASDTLRPSIWMGTSIVVAMAMALQVLCESDGGQSMSM